MRPLPYVLIALFTVACGPTAQVITSPTAPPADTSVPTLGPTPASSPTPLASSTPIGPNTPAPTSLSTTTPVPTAPTPEPTPGSPGSPFGAFARLVSFPAGGALAVTDVAVTPGGFVAVGFGGVGGAASLYSVRQGMVWTSVDGLNWIHSVDPSLANVEPISVVARGGDLFMAGNISACSDLDDTCTDIPQAGNGIWHSVNGGPWQLLAQNPDMQHGLVDDMFLAGDRLVAIGKAGENEATVWISQDGITWTSTTDLAGMDSVDSMAIGPAGFSAFGTIYDDAAFDVVLVAATSTDGLHFTYAGAPQLLGTGIDDVAVGPAGLAGVGYETTGLFDQAGVAVHSTDGVNWTKSTNGDGTFAGSALQTVHALASGGYVSIGCHPVCLDDFATVRGAAWYSADGTGWTQIALLEGDFNALDASALGNTGVVVFASERVDLPDDDTGSVIHAWFAPLSSIHP